MKKITLIRHAKSSWDHPGLADHNRPLNKRGRRDASFMAQLMASRGWQPTALVVGHPFEMTDREANNAEAAKRFARQLHGRYGLPVHMADERLTSREAWARLGEKAGKDPTRVDSYAAKLILETWLNE